LEILSNSRGDLWNDLPFDLFQKKEHIVLRPREASSSNMSTVFHGTAK
jgi:hypothetical protein